MNKDFNKAISRFYHGMAVRELKLMNSKFDTPNLTYNSLLYLDIIYSEQGKYTATMIAELLNISSPAVIQKINELARQGFIIKKQSETDKRIFYLFVNEEKMPIYTTYNKIYDKIENTFKKMYTDKEISLFIKMFSLIGDLTMEDSNV